MLGDDALIYSHRLSEWASNGARTGGGDGAGQHRARPARAGPAAAGPGRAGRSAVRQRPAPHPDEDALAFFREENEFRNVRLVEHDDADFAELVARLLVFSTWRLAQFSRLTPSKDPVLAAIAAKGVKELTYHRDYAAQWVVRLGDGTEVSHQRLQDALNVVWPLVDELFVAHDERRRGPGSGWTPDAGESTSCWTRVLATARSSTAATAPGAGVGRPRGRDGVHTEAIGYLLAELQSVARANPDATW